MTMFAVIKTGGKQYKVAGIDVFDIEKIELEDGAAVTFDEVLAVGSDAGVTVGAAITAHAAVTALKRASNGKASTPSHDAPATRQE